MLYDVTIPGMGGLSGIDHAVSGVPTEAELMAAYCKHTGRESIPDWAYFKAFSLFRLAAIAQGVYKRSQLGNASSENAAAFGKAVWALSEVGCKLLAI